MVLTSNLLFCSCSWCLPTYIVSLIIQHLSCWVYYLYIFMSYQSDMYYPSQGITRFLNKWYFVDCIYWNCATSLTQNKELKCYKVMWSWSTCHWSCRRTFLHERKVDKARSWLNRLLLLLMILRICGHCTIKTSSLKCGFTKGCSEEMHCSWTRTWREMTSYKQGYWELTSAIWCHFEESCSGSAAEP